MNGTSSLILGFLLACSFLSSLAVLVLGMGGNDPELRAAMKKALANRSGLIKRAGYIMITLNLVSIGLWTWMAFAMGDWRWAAISWMPSIAGWIARSQRDE